MRILPFQPEDPDEILRLHRGNYKDLQRERFVWQPCRQIESLEKDCFKIVCKNETI